MEIFYLITQVLGTTLLLLAGICMILLLGKAIINILVDYTIAGANLKSYLCHREMFFKWLKQQETAFKKEI